MPTRPQIEVIYEDGELLVVNKPAGVLTIPDRQGNPSILDLLAAARPDLPGLRVVHRLDRDTSGVLVLAKTADAQRALCRQFDERAVEKYYLAIVRGEPAEDGGLIDAPMAAHPGRGQRMVVRASGKAAQTEWQVVERWCGLALLRCRPLTDRQHQIRVHLKHAGMPLLVDELYGSASAFYLSSVKPDYRPSAHHPEWPLIDRLTLHAESVTFTHPSRHERLTLMADLPKDFRATLNQLRKLGRLASGGRGV